jgi:tetratricopeptide (TPR) repeat protein
LLGQLCRYTGRDKEAVEYARYAMGLPKDTNDWFAAAETVASSYMGLEKANEALEVLEEIREHYPDNAMILFKLVACYDFTKRYKEAEEACQHLLKVEPNHPQGKQMLPQIQEKLRKVEAMMAGPAKRDKAGGKDAPAQTSAPDPAVMQAKAAALSQKLQKQVAEIMNSGLSSDEKNKRMTKVQKDFNDELAALMKQN